MKRLMKEEVLAAYEESGTTPQFGMWYEANKNCACAIGAVVAAKKGKEGSSIIFKESRLHTDILATVQEETGLTGEYIDAFISSFDGSSWYLRGKNEETIAGTEDGKAAREAVLEKYPNTVHKEDTDDDNDDDDNWNWEGEW